MGFSVPSTTPVCSDGLYLGRRQVQKSDAGNFAAARRLLMNRAVEAAVIECGAETILGEGIAYDRCAVGVVTNVVADAENLSRWDVQPNDSDYYTTPRAIYRSQVDVVLPSGTAVLNADDALVADFAELCEGKTLFFTVDRKNPRIFSHLAAGERVVTLDDGRIVLLAGSDEIRLCRLGDVPLIGKAKKPADIANVLAATAAAWALGLSRDVLKTGLKTYGIELADPASLLKKK